MLNVSISLSFGTLVSCDKFTSNFIFLFYEPGLLLLFATDYFTSSFFSRLVLLVEFSFASLSDLTSVFSDGKTEGVNLTFLC
jgi:hypothetical protein